MHRRKKFVQVTEVVLAELPGGIALCLQNRCERHGLRRQTDVGASLTNCRQTSTDRHSPVTKFARPAVELVFSIVIREAHTFGREPVEVRRLRPT